MISFTGDNGTIDYNGQFRLIKQSYSILNFKIKGDVSVSMQIPNNIDNRKVLGILSWDQLNLPSYAVGNYQCKRNGNVLSNGIIVIEYIDKDFIQIFFAAGNSNWLGKLEAPINEANFERYTVLVGDVYAKKANTEGIIFPIVDWCYEGQKTSNKYFVKITTNGTLEDDSGTPNIVLNQSNAGFFTDLLPCVYLKTVVNQVLIDAELKLSGDILTDKLYNSIVITPAKFQLQWPQKFLNKSLCKVKYSSDKTYVTSLTNIKADGFDLIDADVNGLYSGDYRAPYTATYKIQIDALTSTALVGASMRFIPYINGVEATNYTSWYYIIGSQFTSVNYVSARQNDKIEIYISIAGTGAGSNYTIKKDTEITFQILQGIYDSECLVGHNSVYVSANAILTNIKGIDLIKFVANFFGCMVTFDQYSQTLTLNKIENIRLENAQDWSDYFVRSQEYFNTGIAKDNYIKYADVSDEDIVNYNLASKVGFGNGSLETSFTQIKEADIARLPFGPVYTRKNLVDLVFDCPYIPFIKFTKGDVFAFTSSTIDVNEVQFVLPSASTINVGDVFYVYDKDGYYTGYHVCKKLKTNDVVSYTLNRGTNVSGGFIYKVSASFQSSSPRLLICSPELTINYLSRVVSPGTVIPHQWYYYDGATTNNSTTFPFAYFDKDKASKGETFDQLKESLAINSIYGNLSIEFLYLNRIKNALNNPPIREYLILPEAVFTVFNFSVVYIKTSYLTGYFLVDSIYYENSTTEAEVNLYKL